MQTAPGLRPHVHLPPFVLRPLASARWLLPHAAIWTVALAFVRSTLAQPACTALCAIYVGWTAYLLLTAALLLSILVGTVELLLPHRQDATR